MIEQDSAAANDEALAAASSDLRVAELEAQVKEAGEKVLRTQAELENYRKRAQRELADERRYAVVPLVRDLLPVMDNLQRAINVAAQTGEGQSLLEGVKLVAVQLEGMLKQNGCVPIETVGATFDPHQHEALAQEPSSEHPAGTITRVTQAGYKLYDRVIRPAQVFVSTGPAKN
jgi:molecular chaperone GrpE